VRALPQPTLPRDSHFGWTSFWGAVQSLFEEIEAETKIRVQEIEDQMAVLRQDVERTRELLTREQDQRLKVVLPKRFQLREVRVLPLALTYLVPATKEDLQQ
jgi:hypothetical protein